MGKKAKKGKNRLDKYYHLAKESGYRSRAAFKLIQLNRRHGFLEKAKCLVDLCAAPGGWLQVAERFMPQKGAIIVGVDLAPIKPVPRCLTFVEDITTDKCRNTIRRELKDWKADVVLHDGAPNVGTSWTSDAYSQNLLTLSSLKLASSLLRQGGTFVTKVFRSRDYNSLLWCAQQLFDRVDATKPESSRQVSAEIFLVCTGFKPASYAAIDKRLLDPDHVFKDLDDVEVIDDDGKSISRSEGGRILNDLVHPEKHRRHRTGYADGDYTMYHTTPVTTFLLSSDALSVLAEASALTFPAGGETVPEPAKEDSASTLAEVLDQTPNEVKACCSDLRVLGKKEFRLLLRWREDARKKMKLGKYRPKPEKPADDTTADADADADSTDEEKLESEAQADSSTLSRTASRLRKRAMERKKKVVRRLNMGMETPMDIGVDWGHTGLTGIGEEGDIGMDDVDGEGEDADGEGAQEESSDDRSGDEGDSDSDADGEDGHIPRHLRDLDASLSAQYDEYLARKRSGDMKSVVSERRKRNAEEEDGKPGKKEEWWGIEEDKRKKAEAGESDSDSDSEEDEDGLGEGVDSSAVRDPDANSDSDADSLTSVSDAGAGADADVDDVEAGPAAPPRTLSRSAQRFFANPLFGILDEIKAKELAEAGKSSGRKRKGSDDGEDGEDGDRKQKRRKEDKKEKGKNRKGKGKTEDEDLEGSDGGDTPKDTFEIVPLAPEHAPDLSDGEGDNDDLPRLDTAEALTLAHALLRPSTRSRAVDDSFHRRAYNDEHGALPDWFRDDERKHNKPALPVSKEAIETMKARVKGVGDRTIKKVAEAKARKKYRVMKKVEKLKKEMGKVWDDDDPSNTTSSKVQTLRKLSRKVATASVDRRPRPKVVVAKGTTRGIQGRPKGVKGRYKMVDGRMKKEARADKRKEKAGKKGKRRK